jgi:hypothetical protein
MIISDDPARAIPGMVMATRMKVHRNAGPSVKLAASGQIDDQLSELESAGIGTKACLANVEQYGVADEIGTRPLELLAAGAEVA